VTNLDDLLSTILINAQQLLGGDGASIFLVEGDSLVLRAATGRDSKVAGTVRYTIGDGITGKAAEQERTYVVLGDRLIRQYDHVESNDVRSLVVAPIKSRTGVIGVLRCVRTQEEAFTKVDMRVLDAFASTAAAAIDAQQSLELITTAPYMFVLMPFDESFRDIYELGIKDIANAVPIRCERVDEIEFNNSILEQIYKGISAADLVLADMTGRNANVFYEVGYAHALHKDVVLLTQHVEDIPFDLKSHNHIVYGGHIHRLREQLAKRLQAWAAGRAESP
jgi:putative methionine-R-sulfoxide reductase with GAF domain